MVINHTRYISQDKHNIKEITIKMSQLKSQMENNNYQIMGVSNLYTIKTKTWMLKEEIIQFQPRAWTRCSVMNISTILNYSTQQSLEGIWPKLKVKVVSRILLQKVQWHQWALLMPDKQCARISIQLNTGNQHIRTSWTLQLQKIKLNLEDHYGQSIDKLIVHQEGNIRLNLLMLSETTVIIQEIPCP